MNRRGFGLLAGSSLLAMKANGALAAADPALLTSTLTPFGAERAGNADGSIPAWTGGDTTVPAGWQIGQFMPSPYDSEQPTLVINASNLAQHADKLGVGVQAMITKYGMVVNVYPTHRTAAAPQWVYDNIAANAASAGPGPAGYHYGFANAFGGIPFPIPDADPVNAGSQIVWNNAVRWIGKGYGAIQESWAVSNGIPALAAKAIEKWDYPYYFQTKATWTGMYNRELGYQTAPANGIGEETLAHLYVDTSVHGNDVWQLLPGQGRVRRAPEIGYDTPSTTADGICNYDEYFGFGSEPDRYDAKLIGKKELYIPYNNNKLYTSTANTVHQAHFFDPNYVRWELHRVYVVELTLAAGKRNVMSRRTLYIDEDTWAVGTNETYDANGNLFHAGMNYTYLRPDLPGNITIVTSIHNLQTNDWCSVDGLYNEDKHGTLKFNNGYPDYVFDPGRLAAQAQY